MTQVSYMERQEFIDSYEGAAHSLLYEGGQGAYGSLLTLLGPLRSSQDRKTGLRYWAEHERDLEDVNFLSHGPHISQWNLDFALPTVVRVAGDDTRQSMILDTFVSELSASLGEHPGDASVSALSVAIRIGYEQSWLAGQEKKLAMRAKKFTGQRPTEVSDEPLQDLAKDVALRTAFIGSLKHEMWHNVARAHNIALHYPGTTRELMNDRALRVITRPDQEHLYGQGALSPEEAGGLMQDARLVAMNEER